MTIYVNVDSPNLGFPYFNFLVKKITLYANFVIWEAIWLGEDRVFQVISTFHVFGPTKEL